VLLTMYRPWITLLMASSAISLPRRCRTLTARIPVASAMSWGPIGRGACSITSRTFCRWMDRFVMGAFLSGGLEPRRSARLVQRFRLRARLGGVLDALYVARLAALDADRVVLARVDDAKAGFRLRCLLWGLRLFRACRAVASALHLFDCSLPHEFPEQETHVGCLCFGCGGDVVGADRLARVLDGVEYGGTLTRLTHGGGIPGHAPDAGIAVELHRLLDLDQVAPLPV